MNQLSLFRYQVRHGSRLDLVIQNSRLFLELVDESGKAKLRYRILNGKLFQETASRFWCKFADLPIEPRKRNGEIQPVRQRTSVVRLFSLHFLSLNLFHFSKQTGFRSFLRIDFGVISLQEIDFQPSLCPFLGIFSVFIFLVGIHSSRDTKWWPMWGSLSPTLPM